MEAYTAEADIQENVLVWATSTVRSLPDFENRRHRTPDKHPLLEKLLEAENQDAKHCDYTAHLLIQRQTREYAFAVEDVLRVLQTATECINKSEAFWRGDSYRVHASTSTEVEANLSHIARKIVFISKAVKSLQEEDALTFWTSQQRVMVLQQLVSFSRDAVKLRRKLARIKASLEDRVRNVRRVAIMCECEITGNLVPSEIYYQWVKEDSSLYKDADCDTVNVSVQNLSKVKAKLSTVKKVAQNLTPCIQYDDADSVSDSDAEASLNTQFTMNKSFMPVQVYQIDKHIDILHKFCEPGKEDESVCEASLKSMVHVVSTESIPIERNSVPQQVSNLQDVWVPVPSKKCLETIASNVAPPQKFNTYDFVYDHSESRIKEVSGAFCSDNLNNDDELRNQNEIMAELSNFNILENKEDELVLSNMKDPINPPIEEDDRTHSATSVKRLLSVAMEEQISTIMSAVSAIKDVVNRTTHAIRGMEREWVSPETMANSKASGKEFYHLIDFIVETAKLTEDPAFSSRLYPEDKNEIVSVLDPVLRELTNCFMSLHLMHNLVAVDVEYLKELVSGFPKGNLVIRDWVSDPSIDEDLAEMEQTSAAADFDVDIDELFG